MDKIMAIHFSESSPFVLTWWCAVLISGRARWKTFQLVHWCQLFCGKIVKCHRNEEPPINFLSLLTEVLTSDWHPAPSLQSMGPMSNWLKTSWAYLKVLKSEIWSVSNSPSFRWCHEILLLKSKNLYFYLHSVQEWRQIETQNCQLWVFI